MILPVVELNLFDSTIKEFIIITNLHRKYLNCFQRPVQK